MKARPLTVVSRRSKHWLAALSLTLLGMAPAPAQSQTVDLEQLFNAGVNLGWLGGALEAGMYVPERPTWAANFAEHFNAGYPFREISPPATIQSSVSYAFSTVRHWLSGHAPGSIGPARTVFYGGSHLGTGQIWAQKGTCPGCVQNMLQRAGVRLDEVGRVLGSAAIRARGQRLKDLARTFQANNVAEVKTYEPEFASAIAFMQGSL